VLKAISLSNVRGLVKLPTIADMTPPARFGLDGDGGIKRWQFAVGQGRSFRPRQQAAVGCCVRAATIVFFCLHRPTVFVFLDMRFLSAFMRELIYVNL
jgi:hypothetical protein